MHCCKYRMYWIDNNAVVHAREHATQSSALPALLSCTVGGARKRRCTATHGRGAGRCVRLSKRKRLSKRLIKSLLTRLLIRARMVANFAPCRDGV